MLFKVATKTLYFLDVAYSYVHIVFVNNVPAHLDGHAWCQIEFSHERHSPLLSPRGFQERVGHDLWSVESEKIEIVIGTWNVHVWRGKMSKKRGEKSRFGDREPIGVSWYKTLNNWFDREVQNYVILLFQIASDFLSFFPPKAKLPNPESRPNIFL